MPGLSPYVEPPTIPAGMTMDQYRMSRGKGTTVMVELKVTDTSTRRALALIARLLSRRTIEVVSITTNEEG